MTKLFVSIAIITNSFVCAADAEIIINGVTKPRIIVVGNRAAPEPEKPKFTPPTKPLPIPTVPEVKPQPTPTKSGYPLNPVNWNVNGYWNYSRDYIITHLTQGQHARKFNRGWLNSLSLKELQSLHDDDHEGRVHWDYVNGGLKEVVKAKPVSVKTAATKPVVFRQVSAYCPDGNCPRPSFGYVNLSNKSATRQTSTVTRTAFRSASCPTCPHRAGNRKPGLIGGVFNLVTLKWIWKKRR